MAIGTLTAIGLGLSGAGLGLSAILGADAASDQAEAAQKIAEMQNAMAEKVLAQQIKDRETAVGLAQPTAAELGAIQKQLSLADGNLTMQLQAIAKNQELLESVDPALKEAGKQAYQLLKGQEAASLAPIRTERSRQREMLRATLRDQLGSGYETSSAGMEALNRFDQETTGLMSNAQNQTLGAFLGLSAQIRPDIGGQVGRAFGTSSQIAASGMAGLQNIAGRQVGAFTGNPVNYQNVINTAGAPYVADFQKAQSTGEIFKSMGNISGALGGFALGGGKSSTKATLPEVPGSSGPTVIEVDTTTNPYTGTKLFA